MADEKNVTREANEDEKRQAHEADINVACAELQQAARLVARAILRLEVESVDCPTCRTPRQGNLREYKQYVRLSELPDKLRAVALELRGAAAAGPDPAPGFKEAKKVADETKWNRDGVGGGFHA